ncbi:MAG: DUF5519 family protein [Nitrososphaerota archaeon]|nr:DUF5519 family protein [Nitrososphaerota archaeon]
MTVKNAHGKIVEVVSKWESVVSLPHRFGGTEFRLGKREIGHIHGDYQADIAFQKSERDKLVAEGRAEPHHILPQSGWITFRIREEADVQAAVELFRLSYILALKKCAGHTPRTDV